MSFLNKLFGKKEETISNYADFWTWFQQNEKTFYAVVKNQNAIEANFFKPLSAKLAQLREGYYFLTGMYDNQTVELIFTAEGILKNIPFVEDLVRTAPTIAGWRFTALKPPSGIESMEIKMADHVFSKDTIFFYSNDYAAYPDEIEITLVHKDMNKDNENIITNGCFIFLDNFIGELNAVTVIDKINFKSLSEAEKEFIPIEKLKEFLTWREKEFLEKYEGRLYNTEEGNYSVLEAELPGGSPLLLVINKDLVNWDAKASHPWLANMEIKYEGQNNNGMPDKITYEKMNTIEDELMDELKDADGYLNIGRQTGNNTREIYFACKNFRKPSKVFEKVVAKYKGKLDIEFDVYKDKYWKTHNRFSNNNG